MPGMFRDFFLKYCRIPLSLSWWQLSASLTPGPVVKEKEFFEEMVSLLY